MSKFAFIRRGGAALATAAVIATTAGIAGAGSPVPITLEVTFLDAGLGSSTTAELVDPPKFDNFNSQPTDVGNQIVEWGGVRVDPMALASDARFLGDLAGLNGPIQPLDGYSGEDSGAIYRALIQAQIDDGLPPAGRQAFDDLVIEPLSGVTPPTVADFVDVEDRLGIPPDTDAAEVAELLDGLGFLGDPAVGPREPVSMFPLLARFDGDLDGYLLIDSDTAIDGAYLPQNFDNDGVDVIGVRQEMAFAPPLTGGRAENVLRINIPQPMQLPTGSTVGGPTYNGSFPGDIFNNANLVIVSRDDNGSRSQETLAFQDGFWSPIEQIGFIGVRGDTTLFGLPPMILDAADGFGFASFVQDGPSQQEGSVGSTVVPDFGSLLDPSALESFVAPRIDIDASGLPEIVGLVEAELATTVDVPAPAPTPEPPAQPADPEPTPPGEETVSTSDEGDDSSIVPLLLVLLGLGVAAAGLWLWLTARSGGDPCEELRKKMLAAKAACERATADAATAEAECKKATARATALRAKLSKLRRSWPPAFEDDGGAWVEDAHGNRVDSVDLHARRQALGHIWDQYQAGEMDADEVEAEWRRADTPEFRAEMRAKTAKKQAEAATLEADLATADTERTTACGKVTAAKTAAEQACAAYAAAKKAYEECIGQAIADAVSDAATAAANDAAAAAETAAAPTAVAPAAPATTAGGADGDDFVRLERYTGPGTFVLDKSGLSGDELERAERLDAIFAEHKGTGDIAAVAESLHEFQEWHEETFGEPWYIWTTDKSANSVIRTSRSIGSFMETRYMACYEFVHFCAYIASDQLVRQHTGGPDEDDPVLLDDYAIRWDFPDDINKDTSPYSDDTATRGEVVTGASRVDSWNNKEGYYHTGIYVGDGQVISLGGGGLLLEDTTGLVDATFNAGYGRVDIGAYDFGHFNTPAAGAP